MHGRWYGVRGHRFVRPALILSDSSGAERRRLLAELDDKPWAAEDGESWRAAFAVESGQDLDDADGLELSVAPNINVALRSGGKNADGPITATGRVAEEPPAAAVPQPQAPAEPEREPEADAPAEPEADAPAEPEADAPAEPKPDAPAEQKAPAKPDLPFPTPPRRRRARGVPPPPPPEPVADSTNVAAALAADPPAPPVAPRRRPVANRAADVERLTTRLSAAEATLEREQARRDEIEQALERERGEARRTVAELARVKAELEEKLEARTTELQHARKELSNERRQRHEADSRADTAAEASHRAAAAHATAHTPPPPRTDRPINPSLRRSPWLRLLVVLVIAGVLLAVYLVLHSTVLH